MPLTIEIADEQQSQAIDHSRLKQAVRLVLKEAGIERGRDQHCNRR
jgi:hypothetical protein